MPIIVQAGGAFAMAVAGGAVAALVARSHNQLCSLISLGAGTLFGVAAFAVAPECFEVLRWWQFLLAVGTGYGVFAVISRKIFHVCPACAASHFDETSRHRFSEIAAAMMLALSIHCTVDGIALAAGHAEHRIVAGALDLYVALAICVHKIPEGLALGALLLGAGFRRGHMLWIVAAVESTTLLGAALGWLVLRDVSGLWVAITLAHAAGGFLFLSVHAVLGEVFQHHKGLVLGSFAAGVGAIGILMVLIPLQH